MERIPEAAGKNPVPSFLRLLIFIVATGCILIIFPLNPQFQYEYQTGQPWPHEDLEAPFTFPIEKSAEEIQEERQVVMDAFLPFYVKQEDIASQVISDFIDQTEDRIDEDEREEVFDEATGLINRLYENNIIQLADEHQGKGPDDQVRLVVNRVTSATEIHEFVLIDEAREEILEEVQQNDILDRSVVRSVFQDIIVPNVVYDEELSEKELQERLGDIAPSRGRVESGEVVIRQGEIVTEDKAQILQSLEREYRETVIGGQQKYFTIGGYALITFLLMSIFYLYLYQFHFYYLHSYRALILIMVNILLFLFISTYIMSDPSFSIYLVPFCIVPIILIAFFGSRLAFITHLIVIFMAGLLVHNSFEFILVQFVAGFAATLSMMQVRYLSQFFVAVLITFAAYCLSYLGISLIQTGDVMEVNYMTFVWFGGNFILTLLAYPLIYAYEKIFGFVSDITLLELGDVNNKLLKDLSLKAPGTFQHSLQVANLSEAILNQLHGNALLARVAALYHDIGKMNKPEFFIENQQYMNNPHDELSTEESCREIINHVRHGLEMAKKHNLPIQISDIIKTHHGTSRLEFFYRNEINKYSEEEVDETQFRYPGPKPRTKEEAVIMIADSVEAASRSLKEHTAEEIDELIERIVASKLKDNQMDNADITLSEINKVKEHLKKLMKGLFHARIEYPEDKSEKKREK